ncbi:MAG: hypothetical protein C4287_16140 [Leptolyngbya sp. ERB_1_2]
MEIDGNRPIDRSDLDVEKVIYDDGERPIAANEAQIRKTLPVDGDRPIMSDNRETPDMIRDFID